MSAAALLARLDGVQSAGDQRWRAVCPLHAAGDGAASLEICEQPDGWVLIHCPAGCGGADIIAATGLEFGALYPDVREVQP